MIKRIALATLSFTLLASGVMAGQNLIAIPETAEAAIPPDTCFAFNAGTGTITNYYNNEGNNPANPACPKAVDIPSTIGGVPVTIIGNASYPGAFTNKNLTSVTIPSSVTSIGNYAFYSNQLTSLTIPSSVTSIGSYAFSSNQLTSLTIPNSVTSISSYAFFYNQLTSLTIPNSVTGIGSSAFSSNQLTNLTIPNSVTGIGSSAFSYNQLTNLTIPSSVTSIGDSAFRNNQLTNLTIPSSVTSVGGGAFRDNQLTTVTFQGSVTTFGTDIFLINPLTSITYDGTTYTDTAELAEQCYAFSSGTITDYKLDDMNLIKDSGIACMKRALSIPSTIGGVAVTSIGNYAFSDNRLANITIPSSVTSIGDYAFNSNQLTSVTIPSSVNYLGSRAFNYNMLTSATVIGNPETIEDGVLEGNRFLTSITYNGMTYTDTMPTTERCYSISSGVATGYKFADLNAIKNYGVSCLSWDIDIPATIGGEAVTSIGNMAFRDSYFRSVKLPSGLTSIGGLSFANNRISHVTIPSSVISVNPSAFFMQSKWGGYIEYNEPGIPYLYSKDPNVVQEIYDNFWYVRLTTEDPLNANNIKDSVISEDWYHGSDSNANGVNETYGGHLVNPASAELQYVNSANTSLRTSQTFTGKLGSNYLSNYYVTQGPTVPIPADPYNPTPAEQAALDQALSVYYRIGNTPTFTPPPIAGYITPPAQTKELTAANNNLSFTYNQQVLSVPFANNTVTGGTLAPSTTPASITSPLIKESNLAIANDGACSAIESAELLAPGATTAPASVTILGGLKFSLSCSSAATTTVTLTLGSKADLAQMRIYKEASGTLTDITHQVTLANTNGKTVLSYEITDGGSLDEDGVANSTIVDPIYIGVIGDAGGSLANTGFNVYALFALAAALLISATAIWREGVKAPKRVSFR